jgi:hypothetical protein
MIPGNKEFCESLTLLWVSSERQAHNQHNKSTHNKPDFRWCPRLEVWRRRAQCALQERYEQQQERYAEPSHLPSLVRGKRKRAATKRWLCAGRCGGTLLVASHTPSEEDVGPGLRRFAGEHGGFRTVPNQLHCQPHTRRKQPDPWHTLVVHERVCSECQSLQVWTVQLAVQWVCEGDIAVWIV